MTKSSTPAATGVVEALWLKRARRGPMDACDSVEFVANQGMAGSADQGGRRQVTVIASEVFDALSQQLDTEVDPTMRRANVMVRGLALQGSRGRLLAIGSARLRVGGETRPCERMDEQLPGLTLALDPEWRGGIYGQVEVSGLVSVGDQVFWVDEGDADTASL